MRIKAQKQQPSTTRTATCWKAPCRLRSDARHHNAPRLLNRMLRPQSRLMQWKKTIRKAQWLVTARRKKVLAHHDAIVVLPTDVAIAHEVRHRH